MKPTKAFQDWFGDSRVVDAEGRALVVYHGTNREFEAFNRMRCRHNDDGAGTAFHFTSRAETAGDYATSFGSDDEGARTLPVYVSLVRPMVVRYKERAEIPRIDFIGEHLAQAKEGDHDGLIVIGLDEGNGVETHFIAFRPEQIKSAIGNNGGYDAANPDIRFSLAAEDEIDPIDTEAPAP